MAVSPYRPARNEVRNLSGDERFVEVIVSTPLEICEQRDPKGLYRRARKGEIKGFTGIDDPHEPPLKPELILDVDSGSAERNAHRVRDVLLSRGFVRPATA